MYEELRRKAKKRVEAKKAFFTIAMIFSSISVILFIISLNLRTFVAFWVNFPTLIFALILGIMYISIFGNPFSGVSPAEWEDAELEREMAQLYRKKKMPLPSPGRDLSEEDLLELKELERLEKKTTVRRGRSCLNPIA